MNFSYLTNLISWFRRSEKYLDIYTDGSCKGKWGSWAFVVVRDGLVIYEAAGRERKTNSHRMEFQAAIEAVKYLPANSSAKLYTDSKVLINYATNKNKRTAVNSDQTEMLGRLAMQHNISWNWVRAHSGNIYNERCDKLCILARN